MATVDSCTKVNSYLLMQYEANTQSARMVAKISTSIENVSSSILVNNYSVIMNPSELNSSSLSQQKIKVVLLGDSGVGKSSLIDRFVKGEIDHHHQPTVGIDFLTRNILHNSKTYKLQLWDTAGQEKYKSLVPAYLRDANCAVLVFETSRRQTFQNLRSWLALVRDHAPPSIIIVVVANKCDLLELPKTGYEQEVKQWASEERIKVIGASAKSGVNVQVIFQVLVVEVQGISGDPITDKVTSQFFLKYNRANFDYGRKLRCCHI